MRNPGYSLKPTDEFDQPGSKTRNEKIAAVLHEVNLAETKGSGGRVMLEKMLEANLTLPLFVSNRDRDYFHLTLFTHHLLDGEDIEWLTQFKNYGLSNDEAKALVVLKQVGIINNLIYRVTNDVDTLTASQHLRRLRDAGLLEQQGKGSATCYTLNPEFQPQEQLEVDTSNLDSHTTHSLSGQSPNPNLDSSTLEPDSLSGQFPKPNLDSSTLEADSLSGQSPNPNLDSSTLEADSLSGQSLESNLDSSKFTPQQLTLELFPPIKTESLEERLANIGKRTEPEEIKNLILELCKIEPRSSSELQSMLKRQRKYLLDQYLKPLIDEGLLEYTIPEKPNDPHQTYRSTQK
ncbi:Fic family protein [Tolypothrix sp. FACHB-123]|uniref:Fic family protein n=1 Tax=Tolypothrix sp. FACHB-123 TaxID=2692868 RepID=UPI00280A6B00|nr:ATP-binding protein [Tolypothrix sp. FACHB-123]